MTYSPYSKIQVIFFLWNMNLIDGLTAVKFISNLGFQYSAITLSSAGRIPEVPIPIGQAVNLILTPFGGMNTARKYIQLAPPGQRAGRVQDG